MRRIIAELTELAETSRTVANYNVLVQEWEDQVVFMHRIALGQADKSYGVHVAAAGGSATERGDARAAVDGAIDGAWRGGWGRGRRRQSAVVAADGDV